MARRTIETALHEAKKYNSKQEIVKNANSLYQYLWKNKILDIACAYMIPNRFKNTEEELINDALKYNTRAKWHDNSLAMYANAYRRGAEFMDKCCSHMQGVKYWTLEAIQNEAFKYKNRNEFHKLSPKCYAAARRRNIVNDVCSHMKNKLTYHTHESVRNEAKKYNKKIDFVNNYKSAYAYACRHNIIDDITKHMEYCPAGFDKSKAGILYYLRVCGGTAYKIGITNKSVDERYTPKEMSNIHIVSTFIFDNGHECYAKEREILKKFKKYKYTGNKLLLRGNTELFDRDVLLLDVN